MKKLVVGISGASGIQYGVSILEQLAEVDGVETHLIVTKSARRVMEAETEYTPDDLYEIADVGHNNRDIAASVASGSFDFTGMVVCPCSMKTLGYIANGIAEGLVPRVADVSLKENRPLLIVPRESPMSHTHLENMVAASEAGATVAPASPGFYTQPETIDELVDRYAAKLLTQFDIETPRMERWKNKG